MLCVNPYVILLPMILCVGGWESTWSHDVAKCACDERCVTVCTLSIHDVCAQSGYNIQYMRTWLCFVTSTARLYCIAQFLLNMHITFRIFLGWKIMIAIQQLTPSIILPLRTCVMYALSIYVHMIQKQHQLRIVSTITTPGRLMVQALPLHRKLWKVKI